MQKTAYELRISDWSSDVCSSDLGHDDFRSNETSVVLAEDDVLTIRHVAPDGTVTLLKEGLKVLPGEIVDGTFLLERKSVVQGKSASGRVALGVHRNI